MKNTQEHLGDYKTPQELINRLEVLEKSTTGPEEKCKK
jgi:hypothetical protein